VRANEWADDQLWQLFVVARHRVVLGDRAPLLLPDQASRAVAMAGRPADISEADLARFLDSVGDKYLTAFGVANVYEHARLAKRLNPADVHTALERQDSCWTLTVVSLQAPRIFRHAATVLSRFGLDIHRARRISTPDDLAIHLFEFSDARGVLSRTPAATSDLDRMLRSVSDGSAESADLADLRPHAPAGTGQPTAVSVSHDPADRQTIVDVTSDEGRELLPRLCGVVAELGAEVDLALVMEEGSLTRAVLHTTRHGRRLSEELKERVKLGALQLVTSDVLRATTSDVDGAT
jgi:UTP:GlnB (protein PII) uridylyltransferase